MILNLYMRTYFINNKNNNYALKENKFDEYYRESLFSNI